MNIYYDVLIVDKYEYFIACTDKGLVYVNILNLEKNLKDLETLIKDSNIINSKEKLKVYKEKLRHYFLGDIVIFDFPIDLYGTEFQKKVWRSLSNIGYGNTITYTEVATMLGNKNAVRAVATAIGKNPLSIVLPCHRVIGTDGKLHGYLGGIERKRELLNLEKNNRI